MTRNPHELNVDKWDVKFVDEVAAATERKLKGWAWAVGVPFDPPTDGQERVRWGKTLRKKFQVAGAKALKKGISAFRYGCSYVGNPCLTRVLKESGRLEVSLRDKLLLQHGLFELIERADEHYKGFIYPKYLYTSASKIASFGSHGSKSCNSVC